MPMLTRQPFSFLKTRASIVALLDKMHSKRKQVSVEPLPPPGVVVAHFCNISSPLPRLLIEILRPWVPISTWEEHETPATSKYRGSCQGDLSPQSQGSTVLDTLWPECQCRHKGRHRAYTAYTLFQGLCLCLHSVCYSSWRMAMCMG